MRLLPFKKLTQTRLAPGDSLGHGMDAAILLALFLVAGYGLDRVFGTMPVFMIAMSVLGSVGIFTKFKYNYEAKMDEHEANRIGRPAPSSSEPSSSERAA